MTVAWIQRSEALPTVSVPSPAKRQVNIFRGSSGQPNALEAALGADDRRSSSTDDARRGIKSQARAAFTIPASNKMKGLVTLGYGYKEATLRRHFILYWSAALRLMSWSKVVRSRELISELRKCGGVLIFGLHCNLEHELSISRH